MENKHSLRTAVASDQAIYLRGMVSLLMAQPGCQLVGEASTAAETIQLCHLTQPDILLLDLNRTPDQVESIIDQVCQNWPATQVVLLVNNPEGGSGEMAECVAYSMSRDVSEDEFKAALQQICRERMEGGGRARFAHQLEAVEPSQEMNAVPRLNVARDGEVLVHELTMAGKIQTDILPEQEPVIPGWDISASLIPARETSGDFYDFIPLTEHKWGIVTADVSDKGMGAALFMMFTSTLIRTYADRYPTLPAVALSAVSERILSDSRGGMFVTAMFGILEPLTGRFIYANAGHPPGALVSTQRGRLDLTHLRHTGMALGVSESASWKQKIVRFAPGDLLVLYTDGITEAQNPHGQFFGEDRLLDVVLSRAHSPAREVRDSVLGEVQRFVGGLPQQDDIAVVVIRREK